MIKLLHCRHWSWINPFVLETKIENRGAEKQKDSQSEHFKLNKSTASAEDFTCFGSAVVSVPTSSPLPGGQSKDHKVKLNLSAAQCFLLSFCVLFSWWLTAPVWPDNRRRVTPSFFLQMRGQRQDILHRIDTTNDWGTLLTLKKKTNKQSILIIH